MVSLAYSYFFSSMSWVMYLYHTHVAFGTTTEKRWEEKKIHSVNWICGYGWGFCERIFFLYAHKSMRAFTYTRVHRTCQQWKLPWWWKNRCGVRCAWQTVDSYITCSILQPPIPSSVTMSTINWFFFLHFAVFVVIWQVSWVRRQHGDSHLELLTVGKQAYSADPRHKVDFEYPSNWRLKIESAIKDDEGMYECQISTHPPRVITKYLFINGKSLYSFLLLYIM